MFGSSKKPRWHNGHLRDIRLKCMKNLSCCWIGQNIIVSRIRAIRVSDWWQIVQQYIIYTQNNISSLVSGTDLILRYIDVLIASDMYKQLVMFTFYYIFSNRICNLQFCGWRESQKWSCDMNWLEGVFCVPSPTKSTSVLSCHFCLVTFVLPWYGDAELWLVAESKPWVVCVIVSSLSVLLLHLGIAWHAEVSFILSRLHPQSSCNKASCCGGLVPLPRL